MQMQDIDVIFLILLLVSLTKILKSDTNTILS